MSYPYYVIDAFAHAPFSGNAAAVVLDADGLDEAAMQSIAAEFNLSETTFVLPVEGAGGRGGDSDGIRPGRSGASGGGGGGSGDEPAVRFRWFTPTVEVNMCGHATVAGVHALVESGRLGAPASVEQAVTLRIETRSGPLRAFVERVPGKAGGRMIWLDLVDPVLRALRLPVDKLAGCLRLSADRFDASFPPVRTQDDDAIVFVADVAALNDARPDFAALGAFLERHGFRGLSLATTKTLTPSLHVQSRFFAPTAGVDEDPVTGSVHGPLAAYVVQRGSVPVHEGIAALTCGQAKAGGRGGIVQALVQPQAGGVYAVRIGGRAVTVMEGRLHV